MRTCHAKYGFGSLRGYGWYDKNDNTKAEFEIDRFDGILDVVAKLNASDLKDMRLRARCSRLWRKGRITAESARERCRTGIERIRSCIKG